MGDTDKLNWTNESVKSFAKSADPIEAIERRARELTFQAIEKGWQGPPFDPIKLADILRIPISASSDIPDARTVPGGPHGFVIEFNPLRPRGRVRFSIAHEIAHTLSQIVLLGYDIAGIIQTRETTIGNLSCFAT